MLDPSTVFDDSGPLEDPLFDELLRTVEAQLGHRLPQAYVALARRHNGGSFACGAHPAPSRTTWAEDHAGVHVDQERDHRITVLAPDFETFVTGLVDESDYDVDDGDV